MATIKAIEGRSVHQIQSGQVIVDVCSVAKELVENAIDAGATSIEVRFKNNGLDSIEVQDNGSGIAPEDYETIALKHHTSKLSTYEDLAGLHTFGFRGEALSSLCALSKFHIVTARASDGPKGTRLEFEISGKLKGTSVIAARQGTIVVVESLFYNLPVRRKELEKTIKREYNKVLALLHAYACISTGVKFSVSNQMSKGKRTVAFATNSNPNTKENIANVYGTKTILALIPLDLKFEMEPSHRPGSTQSARNWSTHDDAGAREIRIVGHMSRPVVGEGRQTHDRQMFFVNSRPCTLPQVAKAFNEVYKSYNITQSPFIFADIKIDTNAYDVNVSPDKRTILLHDQSALLESLKDALSKLFEGHDQSVPQAQLASHKLPGFKAPTIQRDSVESVAEENTQPAPARSIRVSLVVPEDGDSTPPPPSEEIPHRGFVKASLIERFVGRDTEERSDVRPTTRPQRKPISPTQVRPSDLSERDVEQPAEEDPAELSEPGPTQGESSRVIQDFNARIASQHARDLARNQSPKPLRQDDNSDEEQEEVIPAIKQNPTRPLSQSTVQNAFDRMRPMRTPAQQTTITIGNTTTVSAIDSHSGLSKRARIYTPRFDLDGTPLNQTPKKPLFMKSLRGFAAPGTQMEPSDEEEEANEENVDQDSSMPDAPDDGSPSLARKEDHAARELHPESVFVDSRDQPMPPLPRLDEDMDDGEQPEPEGDHDGSDDEYIEESEKKAREEAKVAKMIAEAEETTARPTEYNLKRATRLFSGPRKRYMTTGFVRYVETSTNTINRQARTLESSLREGTHHESLNNLPSSTQINTANVEERLSLTVTKSDFHAMRIIGQFNLGFILAVRPATSTSPTPDLFIIDQHASDEKYHFERFSATTVLVSQRLVHPHPLELTAIEEEIISANSKALTANGFNISLSTDETNTNPSSHNPNHTRNHRAPAKLLSLPMSNSVTFTPTDLEELLALLAENPPSANIDTQYIPRPSKVRKLLASRACRSSVMVGKTMTKVQMEKVIRHMGEMDKPWSCPHGRPTMRHLLGLEKWEGWVEGGGIMELGEERGRRESGTDWCGYLRGKRGRIGGSRD